MVCESMYVFAYSPVC